MLHTDILPYSEMYITMLIDAMLESYRYISKPCYSFTAIATDIKWTVHVSTCFNNEG